MSAGNGRRNPLRILPATAPEAIAAVAVQIREVVDRLDPAVAASALSYELAAALAREWVPLDVAYAAIDRAVEVMKSQVRAFGTGKAHP